MRNQCCLFLWSVPSDYDLAPRKTCENQQVIMLIGNTGVGKTCFVHTLAGHHSSASMCQLRVVKLWVVFFQVHHELCVLAGRRLICKDGKYDSWIKTLVGCFFQSLAAPVSENVNPHYKRRSHERFADCPECFMSVCRTALGAGSGGGNAWSRDGNVPLVCSHGPRYFT